MPNYDEYDDEVLFLTSLGFRVDPKRYPFNYHHDFVRLTRVALSRGDVAERMSLLRFRWAMQFGDAKGNAMYEAATRLGAILYLGREQPLLYTLALLQDELTRSVTLYRTWEELETALKAGYIPCILLCDTDAREMTKAKIELARHIKFRGYKVWDGIS